MNARVNAIAIAGFAAVLIATMVFAGNQHNIRRMQAAFLGMVTPVLRSGSGIERKVTAYREGLKTLAELEKEVNQLRIANKELKATNQTLRGLEAENNRLRTALGYHERSVFQLMPAQIIGRDASTWYKTIVIDRGAEELVSPDMPVITEDGLVGKTTIVSAHSSVVVLISDESCKVAVTVEGSRDQGIVRGERAQTGSAPEITLNFLSKQARLTPGQKVFTSGVGGVFPAGVLVGEVREFKVRELDAYATIAPSVPLTTLQDVFVVVSETK